MADGIQVQEGSGSDPVAATDDIGGVHYQKIKVALGAENALDTILDSGQQAMADSVPVAIASDQSAVPISASALPLPSGAATAANQLPDGHNVTVDNAAGAAAVNIQDGGNSITVDGTITANAGSGTFTVTDDGSFTLGANSGVDVGDVTINNASGASAVNIQDGGNVISVDDGGSTLSIDDGGGAITVDGTVGVSGSVDTELTTDDLDTGGGTDTRAVVGMVLAESGGGALVGSSNPMPISDNGGSITVDGTVSVSEPVSVDDNGSSLTVDSAELTTLAGTVSGSEVQVDVVAALPAGTNNIGDVDVVTLPEVTQSTHDNLNANANLQVGDADVSTSNPVPVVGNVASDAADSGNPVKVAGVYEATEPSVADGDRVDLQTNEHGHLKAAVKRSSTTTLVSAQTYDNVTTTTTSSSVDARDFRTGFLYYQLSKANTPTTIELQLQGSFDDSTWFDVGEGFLQELIFDDAVVGSGGLDELVSYGPLPNYVRLVVTATGTTASNTFTLTADWTMCD